MSGDNALSNFNTNPKTPTSQATRNDEILSFNGNKTPNLTGIEKHKSNSRN